MGAFKKENIVLPQFTTNTIEEFASLAYDSVLKKIHVITPTTIYTGTPRPCLLKGTLVKTPAGWAPIETIQEGDVVMNHNREMKKVIKTDHWENEYDTADRAAWVYKVPAGKLKASSDLYISCLHRFVFPDGSTKIARQMGYPRASKEEVCKEEEGKEGKYTLYHLRLEDPEKNHLVVNGGCVVECWHK
jgi:hypothetical protein